GLGTSRPVPTGLDLRDLQNGRVHGRGGVRVLVVSFVRRLRGDDEYPSVSFPPGGLGEVVAARSGRCPARRRRAEGPGTPPPPCRADRLWAVKRCRSRGGPTGLPWPLVVASSSSRPPSAKSTWPRTPLTSARPVTSPTRPGRSSSRRK